MAISLHNFEWEQVRLVQVETQPHHIAGVLSEIRDVLEESDCEWDDIYSAYYDCDEDETTTFYEGESAEEGSPGIWTYVVYECEAGEETVITNADINTSQPALQLQKIIADVMATSTLSDAEQVQKLTAIAQANGIAPEILIP
ncbi:hypothetical protein [Alkalinema sp. FACHB-956]|uniref:hypothetical protein n=1 Tax=Alkalinema sp. FACHB-956 TaxID=2692768 RepID=UPI0018EFB3BE|nr:hypothetical protein [Alkalinema sp. FACHB-956]